MNRFRLILATNIAALAAAAMFLIPSASAIQLMPTNHFTLNFISVDAWNQGYSPQEMVGAQPITATDYLTVTVRTTDASDRLAYTLIANDESNGMHYTFTRYDWAGQTNVLRLPYESATWSIGVLLDPDHSTPTATGVTISVCAARASSCSK
jgi:hypothetical protein